MDQNPQKSDYDLAVRVANARTTWACTIRVLLDRGLVEIDDVEWIRDHCIGAAREFAVSGCAVRREFGLALIGDVATLFHGVLRD